MLRTTWYYLLLFQSKSVIYVNLNHIIWNIYRKNVQGLFSMTSMSTTPLFYVTFMLNTVAFSIVHNISPIVSIILCHFESHFSTYLRKLKLNCIRGGGRWYLSFSFSAILTPQNCGSSTFSVTHLFVKKKWDRPCRFCVS